VKLIRSADYYIDLHTGGTEFSIYPLAGYMLHPNATCAGGTAANGQSVRPS
jgi:hypothetical protein